MQKYSAAFWGTTFVKEMSKIKLASTGTRGAAENLGIAAHEEAERSDVVEKSVLPPNGHANGHVVVSS